MSGNNMSGTGNMKIIDKLENTENTKNIENGKRRLKIGGIYRHFKGNIYQVIAVARHSESEEKMVVNQALYGTFPVYVRPYDMFVSEVDRAKYPDAGQRFRFEEVQLTEAGV